LLARIETESGLCIAEVELPSNLVYGIDPLRVTAQRDGVPARIVAGGIGGRRMVAELSLVNDDAMVRAGEEIVIPVLSLCVAGDRPAAR